jgi:hypothetical protein
MTDLGNTKVTQPVETALAAAGLDPAAAPRRKGMMSRRKGGRIEREIVTRHEDAGIHAERVPLSGAAGGSYSGDVVVHAFGKDAAPLVAEVKARANGEGFATLARWLGSNDALFLRQNNADPLVCLPWRSWMRLLLAAGTAQGWPHIRKSVSDVVERGSAENALNDSPVALGSIIEDI